MKFPAAVYTAYKGYAWSNVPMGMTAAEMDALSRMISDARGDFPDPLSVDTGLVSNGRIAAAFTMQNVDRWDINGRAADYVAFVFFPVPMARIVDFVNLISNDFFWTPSHTPPDSVDYAGPAAIDVPMEALGGLLRENRCRLQDPRAVGSLLTAHGARSSRWICLMQPDGSLSVECDPWQKQKENPL